MNVEIGAEAAQFPEKEYINGIAVAVYDMKGLDDSVVIVGYTLNTRIKFSASVFYGCVSTCT
jgi:hypothetical protein